MKIFLIIVALVLVAWIIYSYFASNVEQLKYVVLEKKEKYEIRKYNKYIEAAVVVDGTGDESLREGFRILANYIFGGNLGKQKVAMTAPVLAQEKISMTAPVLSQETAGKTKVVFSMPSKYTLSDLPKTADSRISFSEIPEKKIAAYSFTWYYTQKRIDEKKKEFLEILKNDNVTVVGEPIFAGYNAPGTFPLMLRNEILVEIN